MRAMLLRIAVADVICGVPVTADAPFPEPMPSSWSIQAHDPAILSVAIDRPGDYTVVIEPEPYWEPAEDSYLSYPSYPTKAHDGKICVTGQVLVGGEPKAVELGD